VSQSNSCAFKRSPAQQLYKVWLGLLKSIKPPGWLYKLGIARTLQNLQIKKVLSKDYPKEDKMFTVKTKSGAIVDVDVTREQAFAFVKAELEKLQAKFNELNAMDEFEAGEAAANSLKAKLNKLETDGKLEASYSYDELKKRASGASFASYLTEQGIEKSLHSSATRALSLGKAALAGLKLAKIDDAAILREAAKNAIGGKDSAWHDAVLDWLLDGNTETE
jgi:fumarylacetoacetate (FAA) hydrolase family protein